jgi:hypothetical protein
LTGEFALSVCGSGRWRHGNRSRHFFVYDPFLPHNSQSYGADGPVNGPDRKFGWSLCALIRRSQTFDEPSEIDASPNCVLVNVGRSMLVDMAALQARLEKGDLIAMLDVFDQEPLDADSPLRRLPSTYLTPHRAGGILESVERALRMLTDDLEAFLNGRERQYAVTEAMLANSFSS